MWWCDGRDAGTTAARPERRLQLLSVHACVWPVDSAGVYCRLQSRTLPTSGHEWFSDEMNETAGYRHLCTCLWLEKVACSSTMLNMAKYWHRSCLCVIAAATSMLVASQLCQHFLHVIRLMLYV